MHLVVAECDHCSTDCCFLTAARQITLLSVFSKHHTPSKSFLHKFGMEFRMWSREKTKQSNQSKEPVCCWDQELNTRQESKSQCSLFIGWMSHTTEKKKSPQRTNLSITDHSSPLSVSGWTSQAAAKNIPIASGKRGDKWTRGWQQPPHHHPGEEWVDGCASLLLELPCPKI